MQIATDRDLNRFYFKTLDMARVLGHSGHWAIPSRTYAVSPGGPLGSTVLVPWGWVAPEWLVYWPELSDGEPGWEFNEDEIAEAFTMVLRTNGPRIDGFSDQERVTIHLAEQNRAADLLTPDLADRLIQIAVFGEVVIA